MTAATTMKTMMTITSRQSTALRQQHRQRISLFYISIFAAVVSITIFNPLISVSAEGSFYDRRSSSSSPPLSLIIPGPSLPSRHHQRRWRRQRHRHRPNRQISSLMPFCRNAILTVRGGGIPPSSSLSSSQNPLSSSTVDSSSSSIGRISGSGSNSNSSSSSNNKSNPHNRLTFVFMNEDSPLVQLFATIIRGILLVGQTLLPPFVGTVRAVARFYSTLSGDVIKLQVGLVYAFLGGYYPTLFSALQAAQHSGWNVMVRAVDDLTDEALKVLDEASMDAGKVFDSSRQSFLYHTNLVLKTVDPNKINTACAALWTSWLGITAVLKQEYARVINLSLTLASGMERFVEVLIHPIFQLIVPPDYHQWIPFTLGWICKGLAINVAWKMQRILTASSSAIVGGRIVARSLVRLTKKAWNRYMRQQQTQRQEAQQSQQTRRRRMKYNPHRSYELEYHDVNNFDENYSYDAFGPTSPTSLVEEMITYIVGGIGFWTQLETQIKNNFSFDTPFPLNLVTWPFDLAETAIQWYITETE